ncbi:stabilizer of axonemal microtubules 3-like [Pelodytes ibericus]
MVLDRRQDWHLTSTGVGLNCKSQPHFSPAYVKSTLCNPLPLSWQRKNEATRLDRLTSQYETTSGSSFSRKYPGDVLSQPSYPMPPPHWTVHYNKDFCSKGDQKHWGSRLKPRNQTSQMKDDYLGLPAKPTLSTFHSGPQPFTLENHLNKGPSQSIVASTENKALSGKPFYIKDKGTISLTDIYTTTTARAFRPFTTNELEGYPKKDILTYWQEKDYPKVLGYGLKENPLPEKTLRPPPSMQDTLKFPNAIKPHLIPSRLKAVDNRKTLAQESYQWPLDVKRRHDVYAPMECPWTMSRKAPLPAINAVPKMYETENKTYGSKRLITV